MPLILFWVNSSTLNRKDRLTTGSKVARQTDCAGQRVSIPHADLSVYLITTSTNPLTSDLANIRKQPASA